MTETALNCPTVHIKIIMYDQCFVSAVSAFQVVSFEYCSCGAEAF